MGRRRKSEDEKQSKKIVIYTTEDRKNEFQSAAEVAHFSESELADQIIDSWLKGGAVVTYPEAQYHGNLTGSLHGADLVMQRTVDVPFSCKLEIDDCLETWDGTVSWIVNHGSHFEFHVQARGSAFAVIVGRTVSGWFMALPVHAVCLDLSSSLEDTFYNKEKVLHASVNRIDGVSAVYALKSLYQSGLIS